MKTTAFLTSLGCALALAACSPAPAPGGGGGGTVDKRLADLEAKVGTLQAQNSDLRAKLRTSNSIFSGRSSLADFFASPEFWECTYDSSWSDCSSRCSKQTSDANKACLDKPEGPDRKKCVEDAAATGSTCLMNCPVQTSPTDPPSCRSGGGGGPA